MLAETRLVGISLEMSRRNDQTPTLWQKFMPQRGSIPNRTKTSFISMQVYANGPTEVADASASFTKWAAVEVEDFGSVPEGMHSYTLQGGLYAVFDHQGPATDLSTVIYIFREWLPNSDYLIDDREHFEVLPADYQALDASAQEEFWIPVRAK